MKWIIKVESGAMYPRYDEVEADNLKVEGGCLIFLKRKAGIIGEYVAVAYGVGAWSEITVNEED